MHAAISATSWMVEPFGEVDTKLIFYVFHIDFRRLLFLLLILVNCVRDESCKEKLAPTSPSGSNIIETSINSAHRCTL